MALIALGAGFGAAAAVVGMASPGPAHRAPRAPGTLRSARRRPRHRPPRARRAHRPGRPAAATLPAHLPPAITSGTGRRRVIALTFDDGPGPYTAQVIAELTRLRVPATFFDVGQQLVDFGGELRAELAHGFVVGDHTENHAWLVRLGAAEQYAQIDTALLRLRHLGVPRPRLFRPPYGSMNRITFRVLAALHLTAVLWSDDPADWARPGTAAIIARVVARARPGAIVLLHDGGGDRSETVAALPASLARLRRSGYTFVTVPRLLQLDPPPAHPHLPSFVSDR